jgi:hypothetical protein
MREEEKKTIEQRFLIVMMIWGSILASLIIYLVVCIFINEIYQTPVGDNFPIATLKNAFYGVSFIILVSIRFIRNKLIPEKGNRSENRINYYMGKYTVAILVSSALAEFIGILGLVLFFLNKNFTDLYIFLAISAAAMIFYRPKKSELVELMS